MTLGSYCSSAFNLHWSNNKGKSWNRFIPTQQGFTFRIIVGRDFTHYLTKEDWKNIKLTFDPDKDFSLAAATLSKAHEFWGNGHLRQAFIEGVSALELALGDIFRKKQKDYQALSAHAQSFFKLPNPVKLTILGSLMEIVSEKILEAAVGAIKIRNDIVHKGYTPSDQKSREFLDGLFATVAVLLETGEFKFPFLISGNQQLPSTDKKKK